MAETGLRDAELDAAIDRYWHCVAAQLESGQIDQTGDRMTPFDFDNDLEIVTGAAGTLRAGPAERPIYLAFTPNFSAVRMAPNPSSGHRHGLG